MERQGQIFLKNISSKFVHGPDFINDLLLKILACWRPQFSSSGEDLLDPSQKAEEDCVHDIQAMVFPAPR